MHRPGGGFGAKYFQAGKIRILDHPQLAPLEIEHKNCANLTAARLDWLAHLPFWERLWANFARHITQPGPDRLAVELSFLHKV
ncbi:MAG: hypothetical protein MJH10_19800 [Epibacterium sp.]|nr:hypothetical protein [Epibacterium sp.]NQX75725.1 hypothetical protein [Epibacterium sp.]